MSTPEDITIESRDDLEEVVEQIGNTQSDLERTQAAQNKAVRRAKRTHNDKIQSLSDQLEHLTYAAEAYCRQHRGELLDSTDGKTVELLTGNVRFRAGRDKVRYEDDKDDIIRRLEEAGLERLVKLRKSLSKRTLLKHRQDVEGIKGILIERSEDTISIEPFAA